jgi:phosphohistidine phosphatase
MRRIPQCGADRASVHPMRTLHLLRHAKSSWDDESLADAERPLAPRGRRDAGRMAEYLDDAGIQPQLVLCSSSRRTRQTLAMIESSLGDPDIAVEDVIYAASAATLLGRLRTVPAAVEPVLVIGHNPGMQELVLELAGSGDALDRVAAKFPTCALATIVFDAGGWADLGAGGGVLTRYTTPKLLRNG